MQMVFDAGDLTSAEKAVLLAYCNFSDPHGYCWPGVERIADMTGISPRTVKRARAALTERGLLGSKRRLTKNGQSITSMTRVNLEMLANLKRPPRVYDDNVIEEITFATPDQGTCHDGTPPTSESATVTPPWGHHGPGEGDTVAPYPSGDPSGDPSSSSSEVEDITNDVAPSPEKKTKRTPEQIIIERTHCTPDEARMAVDYIEQQGDGRGGRIRSLAWWVTNREERTLLSDLAHIRRHSAAPTATECGDHHQAMPVYGCPLCAAEIKAGDPEDLTRLRAHLALVGEKARPDLARLLGAPVTPVDNVRSLDEGERIRSMQRRRWGVVGGSRTPLPPHSEYQRLTGMTSDQIGAEML